MSAGVSLVVVIEPLAGRPVSAMLPPVIAQGPSTDSHSSVSGRVVQTRKRGLTKRGCDCGGVHRTVSDALTVPPPGSAQRTTYRNSPVVGCETVRVPLAGSTPDQPSAPLPSSAVHCVALLAFQLRITGCSHRARCVEAVNCMRVACMLPTDIAPDASGSSRERSVRVPVELVVSASESQIAASDTDIAVVLKASGCGGAGSGQWS